MNPWKSYGRNEQLTALGEILRRGRWFFVKITGRRRIGKTTLIQHALRAVGVEIDLVAVNEPERRIRFGSCKRSASKLLADVTNFREHVCRFLDTRRKYQSWQIEYVGIAPSLDADQRRVLARYEVIPQDLRDLTAGLA
jgi:AAA+ ATPase superfamily predicted ATPase